MTCRREPPRDTVIKRPGFGTSVRMRKPSATPPTQTAVEGATPTQQTITVFIDGVDSGLLPQDVTELHLGAGEDCLVRLDHDGATPVGLGEFEFGLLGNCVETEIIYDQGDTIGILPACSSTVDVSVECILGVPTLIVRNAALEIIASQLLSDVLPPIPLFINGVDSGTVSPCAAQVDVETTGTCEIVNDVCTGSGTVTVDDGLGGGGSAGFGC